jgi:hypothetical protein
MRWKGFVSFRGTLSGANPCLNLAPFDFRCQIIRAPLDTLANCTNHIPEYNAQGVPQWNPIGWCRKRQKSVPHSQGLQRMSHKVLCSNFKRRRQIAYNRPKLLSERRAAVQTLAKLVPNARKEAKKSVSNPSNLQILILP